MYFMTCIWYKIALGQNNLMIFQVFCVLYGSLLQSMQMVYTNIRILKAHCTCNFEPV